MQKIHFIEFKWYKENILYYTCMFSRCDTFATYSNIRLTGIILAGLLSYFLLQFFNHTI